MGLSIKCKKTGTTYYLGYVGMFRLRSKVAELFDKELGYLYDEIIEQETIDISASILKKIRKNG